MKIKTNSFFLLQQGACYSSIPVKGGLVFSGIRLKNKEQIYVNICKQVTQSRHQLLTYQA